MRYTYVAASNIKIGYAILCIFPQLGVGVLLNVSQEYI